MTHQFVALRRRLAPKYRVKTLTTMAATSFAEVANHFVKFYYEKFSTNRYKIVCCVRVELRYAYVVFLDSCCYRAELLPLYRNESMLSWEDKTFQGAGDIVKKFQEIPLSVCDV